jgi:glycerophosphoryl diester phosphodiesterase
MSMKPLIAVGHRGAAAYAPENTIPSIEEALRLGAKAVELDVRLTADGIPVVLHDATVDRTTDGRGPVAAYSLHDLQRLDAGSWMDTRFAGTRIPTLEEALEVIGQGARPVIELKMEIPTELLLGALRRYDLQDKALVISFEDFWLAPYRRASRDLAIGLLVDQWNDNIPARARYLAAELVCLNVDILGPGQVAACEAQALEVWCFTANDIGMVAACAAMGVTGVVTDRPDLIRTR